MTWANSLSLLGSCWGFAGFALFRAVLHIFPVACPLFAPFKGQVATLTYLGFEAIFCLSFHGVKRNAFHSKVTLRNKIKVVLHDKAQGYLVCVPLAGIEPATLPLVMGMLYPMSYSGTQLGI